MTPPAGALPSGRLERHSLLLGAFVLLAGGLLLAVAVAAGRGFPLAQPWPVSAIVPADAPPLNPGDEVRVHGARFGEVEAVEPHPEGALVRMSLDAGPVGAGARARVRVRGLTGVAYVALDRGELRRPRPRGVTLPAARTAAATELVDVLDVFDPPARRSLRRVAPALGAGVIGRGEEVNATIGDLAPALAGTARLARAISPRPGALSAGLADARRVLRAAAPQGSRELEVLVPAAASVLETLAARSRELEASVGLLPEAEGEALATLPEATALFRESRATLAELRPAARTLPATLRAVDSLLAGRAGLRSSTRLARAAEPTLARARPLLVELRPAAATLPVLLEGARPLIGELARYGEEIRLSARGLRAVTARPQPQGRSAGRRALRTVPVFTCHRPRDPYPSPGEARRQRRACRD